MKDYRLKKIMMGSLFVGGMTLLTHGMTTDSASSTILANVCNGCHGTYGYSSGPATPNIAGLGTDYFVLIMQHYRDAQAISTIMGRIAKGYTDEAFKALAEYYAKQPVKAAVQTYDAAKATAGAALHNKYCEVCHEDGGRNSGDAGVLAGQWMPYLRFTLADFLDGHRDMPQTMQKQLKKLDADGIEALVNFYGSQQ